MQEFSSLLDQLHKQRPASWDQLPDFALYMDQILSYMDRQIIPFDEADGLTAAMVNNYTKSGLVPRAKGKKYDREHLAYLTAICVLKQVLSAKDIDLLIRESVGSGQSVEAGYASFCDALDKVLNRIADEVSTRDNDSLAYDAIHFALLSYAAGVACSRYVSLLREKKAADSSAPSKKAKKEVI